MADTPPTGCKIFRVILVSLKVMKDLPGQLTVPQLFALEADLRGTLAVVCGEIHARQSDSGSFAWSFLPPFAAHLCFTCDYRVIINMSDYKDSSDEEKEGREDARVGSELSNPIWF
jgi:hypothetical protein